MTLFSLELYAYGIAVATIAEREAKKDSAIRTIGAHLLGLVIPQTQADTSGTHSSRTDNETSPSEYGRINVIHQIELLLDQKPLFLDAYI